MKCRIPRPAASCPADVAAVRSSRDHHTVSRGSVPMLAALVLLLVAVQPLARAGESGYKCPLDTQTCLNQMVAKLKTSGWLGIEYDDSSGRVGMKITRVIPGSPAEAAGFKAGDVLVSLNGARFADDNLEQFEKARGPWVPGAKLTWVVSRAGKQVELHPTLAALPPDVMAQMIGLHMMGHAQPAAAEKK